MSDLSKRAGEKKDVTIPPRSAWASSPMATHATMVPRSLPLLHPKQRDMKSRVHDRQHPGELLNSNVIMRAGATRTAAVIRWPRLQFAGLQHKTGPQWPYCDRRELSPSGGGERGLQAYRESHIASLRTEPSPSSSIRDVAPSTMYDDDLDRRADSLESHLHRWIALGECDGQARQVPHNAISCWPCWHSSIMLTADSTGK